MGDLTHPAEEVPGGLWPGAVLVAMRDVWDDEDGLPLAMAGVGGVVLPDGMVWHDAVEMPYLPDTWAIVLDGPLSLGLAGLAARVAERLRMGQTTCPIKLVDSMSPKHGPYGNRLGWLQRMAYDAAGYDGGAIEPLVRAEVCWLASYLTLSDRLCSAILRDPKPCEVGHFWRCPENGWVLHLGRMGEDMNPYVHEDTHDVMAALRLALRAVEGGGE